MLDLIAFIGGAALVSEKNASAWTITGGFVCLLVGVLLALLLIFKEKLSASMPAQQYPHTRENCPHRGEQPRYSWWGFGNGYKYYSVPTFGEDGRTAYTCTKCGFGGQTDRGTGAFVFDLLALPAHP
jgi:hypothetical protein